MTILKPAFLYAVPFGLVGDDYPDAYIPELWANESLAILEENMVLGNLVHRDFENVIQNYGDTVNTRKPGEFKTNRKTPADSIVVQSNTATNVPVVLNQHLEASFIIKDADQSKAFKDLVTEYLRPAMLTIGRSVDTIISGQLHQFHANSSGHLGGLTGDTAQDYLLEARQVMNINKAYVDNRNLVLGTISETQLLKNKDFTRATFVGDEGTALRKASLGEKFGFDIFMAQNTPFVTAGQAVVSGAINNAAGYNPGATTFTVDGLAAAITAGTWLTIAGDDTPLRVVSTTGGSTPTAIVVNRGLTHAVVDNAVITLFSKGANTGAQAVGYPKYLTVSGAPQVGMPVTFGTDNTIVYTIIDVVGGTILLDRPLEAAVADSAAINYGPIGSYNFAFHKNALALVNRPLSLPMSGAGARAAVANWNGIAMRVVMSYDHHAQGHLVTVDTLLGVKVLDLALGAVMLG